MDTISVVNFEKYHPTYKDSRKLIWIRWDIAAIHDYKLSKLNPCQRWLLLGLLCLAAKTANTIPYDCDQLAFEINYPAKSIDGDLRRIAELNLILVTKCDELSQNVTSCDKMLPTIQYKTIQDNNKTRQDNDVSVFQFFDYFLLKTKKAFKLTPTAKDLIRRRMSDGFTLEQMKTAVDNFVNDPWEGRKERLDLIYCIGVRNKIDNLDKWLNASFTQKTSIPESLRQFVKER